MGPSGAGPAGGDPGAGLRSSGIRTPTSPPRPTHQGLQNCSTKMRSCGSWDARGGSARLSCTVPPVPPSVGEPQGTSGHVSAHKAVGGSSQRREATARIIQPSPRPITCVSWGGSRPTGGLHGHAGPWGDSRVVCPPTSLQMQPPKPAALPGGATPSKGFPPLSGP